MPLQNIVLHLDSGRACAARLDYALALASEHGAHLTGVYVTGAPVISGNVEAFIGDDIIAAQKQLAEQDVVDSQELFEERLAILDGLHGPIHFARETFTGPELGRLNSKD